MGSESQAPVLYVFAISHYCEKARWALEFLGIDHTIGHLAPGAHMEFAKRVGAPGSSVPLLVMEGAVVQGSGKIIDWAEASKSDPSRRLDPDAELAEACRALEQRLDDVAGVHVRRYYYSEALVEYPETVRPIFTRDLSEAQRRSVEENWDLIVRLMIGAMDLGAEQGKESRRIIEAELDFLDGLLADGRRYLVGDRFSRADVTAASLFAPLVLPEEHPTYARLEVPVRARADLAEWAGRPIAEWVLETYRAHRRAH